MDKKEFYSIFGGPFAPKTVFAEKLCEKYGFSYISVGKLMLELSAKAVEKSLPDDIDEETRININDFSELFIHRDPIPGNMLAWLISLHMKRDKEHSKFIVDGYPRNANEFYSIDEVEAKCRGAISLHANDFDAKNKMVEAREKEKIDIYTDKYIDNALKQYHKLHDEILTKYMISSNLISLDSSKPVDVLVDECFEEMKQNDDDDEEEDDE